MASVLSLELRRTYANGLTKHELFSLEIAIKLLSAHRAEAKHSSRRSVSCQNWIVNAVEEYIYQDIKSNTTPAASKKDQLLLHSQERLAQSYKILKLIELAREIALIPKYVVVEPSIYAQPTTVIGTEFHCSSVLPAHLTIKSNDGYVTEFSDLFRSAETKFAIIHDMFPQAPDLTFVTSVLDRFLKRGEMKKCFVLAANMVARNRLSLADAMSKIIEPGYCGSAIRMNKTVHRHIALIAQTLCKNPHNSDLFAEPDAEDDLSLIQRRFVCTEHIKFQSDLIAYSYVSQPYLAASVRHDIDATITMVGLKERALMQVEFSRVRSSVPTPN